MADNQRVHPTTEDVDKNAGEHENEKPSSPLAPKSSLASDKIGVYSFPSGGQVFQPRIPKYSADSIQITNFSINSTDLSTNCQFAVTLRARNPNKKIGIYYLDNSHLALLYSGTELCKGALPVFYQGHKNTTFLDVALTGTGARLTSAMVSTLKEQQQKASVPLTLKADVPVKLKLWKLKSLKVKVRVQWDLVFETLDANAKFTTEKSKVTLKL